MNDRLEKTVWLALVLTTCFLPRTAIAVDGKTLNYGVGLRVGGGYTLQGPNSPARSTIGLMQLDVRPYISGQVHQYIKFEGNLDLNNGDQGRIHVLDAVGKFEPNDLYNLWFGRFLPPSDRANLSGPYYQNAWNFPSVNGYPAVYAGRADGAAFWGQIDKGRFKYQAGLFTTNPATVADRGIYAGRLTLNLLDREPGYYNSSTYYGAKDILAIGGAIQYQKLGGGTVANPENLLGFNFDLLFEKRLVLLSSGDTVSLEGAYYNFNQGSQGQSFFALASYLLGTKLGIGQLQPMARYGQLIPSGGGDATKITDGGVNYIIDGHKTRLALVVQNINPPAAPSTTSFQLGIQIQE